MLRIFGRVRRLCRQSDEDRGAVLVLVAATLTIMLVAGAMAVDLSALEAQGESLQGTADAASLAGAGVWADTGDQAQASAAVSDIVTQNGIDLSETTIEVTYPSDSEVTVVLTDNEPEVFLSQVVGIGNDLVRDASAEVLNCDSSCDVEIVIPRPFEAVAARGSGDGYQPIRVGERFFAIHHNGDSIVCIDRTTQRPCWPGTERYAYSAGTGGHNPQMPHTAVHSEKIWWAASDSSATRLFCWDTVLDVPCPSPIVLNSRSEGRSVEGKDRHKAGGTILVNERIYVFSDDHRVHCFDPALLSTCGGYASNGNVNSMGTLGFPSNEDSDGNHGGSIDRVYDENTGRIYASLHIANEPRNPPAPLPAEYQTGTWVHCWDTNIGAPCSSFAPVHIHNDGSRQSGRLFFYRDTTKTPIGLCSGGFTSSGINSSNFEIQCLTLSGVADATMTTGLSGLESAIANSGVATNSWGDPHWNESSNRVIYPSNRRRSRLYCHDFDTGSCGERGSFAPGVGSTQDYAYTSDGDCVIGLGHEAIFWSFKASDINSPCTGGQVSTPLTPCECNGQPRWGVLEFNIDLDQFNEFEVQIFESDGTTPLFPADGFGLDLIANGVIVDITELPLPDPVVLTVTFDSDDDPWSGGDQTISVSFGSTTPRLTE